MVICWLQAASMIIFKLADVTILGKIISVKAFYAMRRKHTCTIQKDFLLPQHLLPGTKAKKQNSSIDIHNGLKNSVLKCKYPPRS